MPKMPVVEMSLVCLGILVGAPSNSDSVVLAVTSLDTATAVAAESEPEPQVAAVVVAVVG